MNIAKLKLEIDEKGYTELKSFISRKELDVLKKLVNNKLIENNNQYFFYQQKTLIIKF